MKGVKIENGTYNGEDYRFVVLRKTVLYPQKTGTLEIEPLTLDITVDVPTNRRDIFGGRLMQSVHRTVAAGSRSRIASSTPVPSCFWGISSHDLGFLILIGSADPGRSDIFVVLILEPELSQLSVAAGAVDIHLLAQKLSAFFVVAVLATKMIAEIAVFLKVFHLCK